MLNRGWIDRDFFPFFVRNFYFSSFFPQFAVYNFFREKGSLNVLLPACFPGVSCWKQIAWIFIRWLLREVSCNWAFFPWWEKKSTVRFLIKVKLLIISSIVLLIKVNVQLLESPDGKSFLFGANILNLRSLKKFENPFKKRCVVVCYFEENYKGNKYK